MHRAKRRGFSLLELILVIGIIALIMSLLLPAIQYVRAAADKTRCMNNMRQIGTAMHHCQASRGTLYPSQWSPNTNSGGIVPLPRVPEASLSWMALLLPYIEQDALFVSCAKACSIDPNPFHNPPHVGLATVVPLYVCPTDGRLKRPLIDASGMLGAYTSYVGIESVYFRGQRSDGTGVFAMARASIDFIRDGASNTVMLGERPPPDPPLAGWWYPRVYGDIAKCHGPNNTISLGTTDPMNCDACIVKNCLGPGRLANPCDRYHLWSLHPGGGNLLFADCSVRFLRYSVDPIMPALVTVNGGESVELPD